MRFHALATDYDGTLADNGIAGTAAIEALRQLRKSGRRSILVTGRLLADLRTVFPELELLDAVVAENGAVLYDTSSSRVKDHPDWHRVYNWPRLNDCIKAPWRRRR
jgi:HAD superfamily hydrolase (TIGR01484 family)